MSRHLMAKMRRRAQYDDLPPLPDDFHIPDSPEGQPDRSPGWLHRQFVAPHKSVWDIPEHELDDRWNKVYDTLGFDDKTRQEWEAGRHTGKPSDKWDGGLDGLFGGGVKDYLTRAPMSKDEYARHREHSQNRAKELADGLWNAMYPPEEEEGRKAIKNTETVNGLLNQGWQPEHIKYDEDDEPYALYQHPSGWNVSDYGGAYKNIGHAATPGEAHDAINVSRHDQDSRESYNAPFGPADAHNFIEKQLNGDPEETGGTLHYLTQNHPAIRRYKPRQAGVVALAMSAVRYAEGVIRGGRTAQTSRDDADDSAKHISDRMLRLWADHDPEDLDGPDLGDYENELVGDYLDAIGGAATATNGADRATHEGRQAYAVSTLHDRHGWSPDKLSDVLGLPTHAVHDLVERGRSADPFGGI